MLQLLQVLQMAPSTHAALEQRFFESLFLRRDRHDFARCHHCPGVYVKMCVCAFFLAAATTMIEQL
jgi:hypothetical protein